MNDARKVPRALLGEDHANIETPIGKIEAAIRKTAGGNPLPTDAAELRAADLVKRCQEVARGVNR